VAHRREWSNHRSAVGAASVGIVDVTIVDAAFDNARARALVGVPTLARPRDEVIVEFT
jgi:hypothetical protein